MAKGKGAGAGVCFAACPGPFIAGPFPTFTAAPARAGTKTPATSSAPGLIVLLFIVVSSTFSFSCCAAPSRTPARKYARTHALTSPLLFPPLYLSLRPPLSPLSPLLTPLAHPHVLGHHTHTHTHTPIPTPTRPRNRNRNRNRFPAAHLFHGVFLLLPAWPSSLHNRSTADASHRTTDGVPPLLPRSAR